MRFEKLYRIDILMRNSIIPLTLLIIFCSFTATKSGEDSYTRLVKAELKALRHNPNKQYFYTLTSKQHKDCNKTRIVYLGILQTKSGKQYKVLTTFFVFDAASTCHGSSRIKIYDMSNHYIGCYNVEMPDGLPDVMRHNKLIFTKNSKDCERRKNGMIDLNNGISKRILLPCGDSYEFE